MLIGGGYRVKIHLVRLRQSAAEGTNFILPEGVFHPVFLLSIMILFE
jgi:hypothetical protein